MAKCFIDLTEDERQWNGEIPIRILSEDGLGGDNMAIAIGDDVEVVLTINQAITLFDLLDAWVNGGPAREVGAVNRRIHDAIRELSDDRGGLFKKVFGATYSQEAFVRELGEYLKLKGLRFRLTDDQELGDGRRAQYHARLRAEREKREARDG